MLKFTVARSTGEYDAGHPETVYADEGCEIIRDQYGQWDYNDGYPVGGTDVLLEAIEREIGLEPGEGPVDVEITITVKREKETSGRAAVNGDRPERHAGDAITGGVGDSIPDA